ncbi:hypothetical protein LEN26_006309 [Aphanomyces euteiches]|nr:hypothetical protein LEN26_006309 [Aphanomyces euteiches]
MKATTLEDVVSIEFAARFRATGMGLQLCQATYSGIGALYVASQFEAPPEVVALPPCRYQVDSIGDQSVRTMAFRDITVLLTRHTKYPVVVRFVLSPKSFNLIFDQPHERLNLKIQEHKNPLRCEIVNYLTPYRSKALIPSLLCGSHYIRAVNGVNTTILSSTAAVLESIQQATYPLVISVDIVQTAESQLSQTSQVAYFRRRPQAPAKRKSLLSPAAANAAAPSGRSKRFKVSPATIILDDSEEETSAKTTQESPDGAGVAVDKVVSTPYGKGIVLAFLPPKELAERRCKVELPFGVGFFQQNVLASIDDKTQFTYNKQKPKGYVVLTYGDTARLQGKRLLNDSVLEFYLSYLMDTKIPKDKTYICSSFLFGQYLENKKQGGKAGGREKGIDQAYESVSRWTKAIDIFDMKYFVVPINEEYVSPLGVPLEIQLTARCSGHWSVAIVCNLYRFKQLDHCRCSLKPDIAKPPAKAPTKRKRKLPTIKELVKSQDSKSVPILQPETTNNEAAKVQDQGVEAAPSTSQMDAVLTDTETSLAVGFVEAMQAAVDKIFDEVQQKPQTVDKSIPSDERQQPSPVDEPVQMEEETNEAAKPPLPATLTGPVVCEQCNLPRDTHEDENHRPCILVLDSLKAHRTNRISTFLREYLQMEWNARQSASCGSWHFNMINLPAFGPPEIPRQANYTDCGVFVLHYVEKFLEHPPLISKAFVASRGAESQNILTAQWFPSSDIQAKRIAIRQLIEKLAQAC